MGVNHRKLVEDVTSGLSAYQAGYLLTLNALMSDTIKQEAQIEALIYWLNCFCYSRTFRRNEIRLMVVGASEVGTVNQGLHMHLMIMHNNDTRRTFNEIENFVRTKWYRIVSANRNSSKYGNLVDLRVIDDLVGCIEYVTKTHSHSPNEFNLQYY